MNLNSLSEIASYIVSEGKGILAADEVILPALNVLIQ